MTQPPQVRPSSSRDTSLAIAWVCALVGLVLIPTGVVLGPIAFAQARKAVRYGAEGSGIVALRIVAGLATGVSALVLLAPIVLLMTSG